MQKQFLFPFRNRTLFLHLLFLLNTKDIEKSDDEVAEWTEDDLPVPGDDSGQYVCSKYLEVRKTYLKRR